MYSADSATQPSCVSVIEPTRFYDDVRGREQQTKSYSSSRQQQAAGAAAAGRQGRQAGRQQQAGRQADSRQVKQAGIQAVAAAAGLGGFRESW